MDSDEINRNNGEAVLMWEPDLTDKEIYMIQFRDYINNKYNLNLETYQQLWQWSVDKNDLFWMEFMIFSDIILEKADPQKDLYHTIYNKKMCISEIPEWFPNVRLNYTENILRHKTDNLALIAINESQIVNSLTYNQLRKRVIELTIALQNYGIKKGDIVAGILANEVDAVICMLSIAAIGGYWTSISPDTQLTGILIRIQQIKPKILIVNDKVNYNGKIFSQLEKIFELVKVVTSIELVLSTNSIPLNNQSIFNRSIIYMSISDFSTKYGDNSKLENFKFTRFPFNHALFIMYSSGTTGLPKGLVHSAGGTLIQHIKEHFLHSNLKNSEVMFFYTITSWMMWNWMISALFTGCTLVLYNGSPFYPSLEIFWEICSRFKVNIFGCGAAYLQHICTKEFKVNISKYDLGSLRCILSTGSVLSDHLYDYIFKNIKCNIQIGSISGGTDIISCFMSNNSMKPVYKGELQAANLGMSVYVYDDTGKIALENFAGELVCTKPFPCMPVYIWNDLPDNYRYKDTYFSKFNDVWCQGDYCSFNTKTGGFRLLGRSDATLNPNGIRFGSSEIYAVVDTISQIKDSLVVSQQLRPDIEDCFLFIVSQNKNDKFDESFLNNIKIIIRNNLSPKHVPKNIFQISDIPYTQTGKKMELMVKRIISRQLTSLPDTSNMRNPDSLEQFFNLMHKNLL